MKIIIIIAMLMVLLYRVTKGFGLNLVQITDYSYSVEKEIYLVDFLWNGEIKKGFLLRKNIPDKEATYKVIGYDVSKERWHIIPQS